MYTNVYFLQLCRGFWKSTLTTSEYRLWQAFFLWDTRKQRPVEQRAFYSWLFIFIKKQHAKDKTVIFIIIPMYIASYKLLQKT